VSQLFFGRDLADKAGCVVTEKGVAERKEGEKSIDVASIC
jgi:methylthioribose-1-phosphate isomerase